MSEPWNDELPVGGRGWAKRALEAEAIIQRVRDVCDRELVDAPLKMMSPGRLGYRNALRDVLRAMDGDGDD